MAAHNTSEKEENEIQKSETAKAEEEVLQFWEENDIFKKTLEQTKNGEPFVFLDGPPFATGEPHYGHILAGTIKDAIPRYQTMKGRYVPRQWGWDCHGLPLENEMEKELGLKTKKDIEEYGVKKFNETARAAVLRYDEYWKQVIPRFGRFVDMDRSYKTMDWTYTESIWWAFEKLYNDKLAYEGFKPMHLCPRCGTTLANFEVAQGYADIEDIAVFIKLPLTDEENTSLLAWTTTAWTLPGNMAAAVNRDAVYSKFEIANSKSKTEYVIVAKERADEVLTGVDAKQVDEFTGETLIGKSYTPPFDYYTDKDFKHKENAWRVYHAPYVSLDDGTGIVHLAPAFGAEDMELAQEHDIPLAHHVSPNGVFTEEVTDFAGMSVKPKGDHQSTDGKIAEALEKKDILFKQEKITHSYPHCWRCDTPLLNYATYSWFVRVSDIKQNMVSENKDITWVPEHVGKHRFHNMLEDAPDWSISRARYWGAPLPVWQCEQCKQQEVFGSVDALYKKAEGQITKFIFVRHGESEKNTQHLFDSSPDSPHGLTTEGKKQAQDTAEGLRGIEVHALYTSDIKRTQETADILGEAVGVSAKTDERVREVNNGAWEGKTIDDPTIKDGRDAYLALPPEEQNETKRGEKGESWADVEKRMEDFMEEMTEKHKGGTVVVVTHLGNITAAHRLLQQVPLKDARVLGTDPHWTAYAYPHVMYVDNNTKTGFDFHRPYIDAITIPCDCGGEKKRILDVFDCWFESGSMPYSRLHYPFEYVHTFKEQYPADFIAEGVDQTRGWFYSLLALGTALFGKAPYKNVIVNGQVLASDGKKMSKRLKNYPDPMDMAHTYGADSVRYYFLSSPIVRSEDTAFIEKSVDEIHKKLVLRLRNVYSLYDLYKTQEDQNEEDINPTNVLDQWIIARINALTAEVTDAMDAYELDKATRPIGAFIDDLSTWYIRRSRERFKSSDEVDKKQALQTTRYVLLTLTKIMAPFTPFVADDLYRKLSGRKESVHLDNWPGMQENNNKQQDTDILEKMDEVRHVVSLGLEARANAGIKVRQPLSKLKVKSKKLKEENGLKELIKDEMNVKEVVFDQEIDGEVELDTEITEELKQEGQARELQRGIQNMRKNAGLTPEDRISLTVQTSPEGVGLIGLFEDTIKQTTRADDITFADEVDGEEMKIGGLEFIIAIEKK